MSRTLVWRGLDAPRMEIAHVLAARPSLLATGTQIGVAYELRYELAPSLLRVEVVGVRSAEIPLGDADFFDLGYSPLFNSLPVLDGLDRPRDFVMTWVAVPELEVERSHQTYEPVGDGVVRFRSGSFSAELELDADGFVVRYPGLAERVA